MSVSQSTHASWCQPGPCALKQLRSLCAEQMRQLWRQGCKQLSSQACGQKATTPLHTLPRHHHGWTVCTQPTAPQHRTCCCRLQKGPYPRTYPVVVLQQGVAAGICASRRATWPPVRQHNHSPPPAMESCGKTADTFHRYCGGYRHPPGAWSLSQLPAQETKRGRQSTHQQT
jgi:hypothetical protein